MRKLRHYQRGVVGLAVLISLATAPMVHAQAAASPRPSSPVTWKDGRRLGIFALASVAAMPLDREGQRLMQRPWVQESALFKHGADVFNAYGSPGVFVGSFALYGAGWVTGRPDVARMGLRTIEAIGLSGIVTGGIKGLAGRARPYASPQRPGDWRLLSGTHDGARQSFPSGHTTAVFAFASAMTSELRVSHPATARWAGPTLYTTAALTGLARMHSNNHWASDVIMGAGIGTVAGLIVARFHADRPQHWIDRRLLPR
jgi:membrane-associated phospholipid phosphatase